MAGQYRSTHLSLSTKKIFGAAGPHTGHSSPFGDPAPPLMGKSLVGPRTPRLASGDPSTHQMHVIHALCWPGIAAQQILAAAVKYKHPAAKESRTAFVFSSTQLHDSFAPLQKRAKMVLSLYFSNYIKGQLMY